MVTNNDLDGFSRTETVDVTLFAKDRDGTPLSDAAAQTLSMTIGETPSDPFLLEFNTTPQITLQDAPTAQFLIRLLASDLTSLVEDTRYYYNMWSDNGSNVLILQSKGEFYLKGSIEAA